METTLAGECSLRFPVYISLAGLSIHPHVFFEGLGYATALGAFFWLRKRHGDAIDFGLRWSVVAAAFAGGVLGSKLLYWAEDPRRAWLNLHNPAYLLGGKTIVGGLLGGWAAVELMKRFIGFNNRTGDLFAVPVALGVAIGRIGCFLTGLSDETYGTPTRLPWGVDFGDGVRRHPTQLYEMLFMLAVAVVLYLLQMSRADRPMNDHRLRAGDLFRMLIAAYLGMRVLIEFIKPVDPAVALGMNSIQWASLLGAGVALWQLQPRSGINIRNEAAA